MDFVNIDTKVPLYSASVATIMDGDGAYRNIAAKFQSAFWLHTIPLTI